ncbi:MAG: MFS transporter [Myxococcota bacterium]
MSASEASADAPAARVERVPTFGESLTYALPQIALNASGMIIGQWLVAFYRPAQDDIDGGTVAFVTAAALATILFAGRIVDAIADPIIGHWSDRTHTRWGRRLPFILFGTPLLVVSFCALWFPPFGPESLGNALYLGLMNGLFWIAFTAVVAPYFALLPEIATRPESRGKLSAFMGVFIVLGNLVGVSTGAVHSGLSEGVTILEGVVDGGVHLTALQVIGLLGGLALCLFFVPLLNIRETERAPRTDKGPGIYRSILSAAKNPAFWPLLGIAAFLQGAALMLVTVLPFLTQQILEAASVGWSLAQAELCPGVFRRVLDAFPAEGGLFGPGEGGSAQAILFGVLFLGAVVWMPVVSLILKRVSRKRLLLVTGVWFGAVLCALPSVTLFADPAIPAIVAMALLSFPAAVALVLPNVLYGDVVDYDETRTGERREGVYTGSMALVTKTALGAAQGLVVLVLAQFGDSRSDPTGILLVGPVAGVMVFVGVWIFRYFPQEEIDAKVAEMREATSAD